jgi:hypothetical protein
MSQPYPASSPLNLRALVLAYSTRNSTIDGAPTIYNGESRFWLNPFGFRFYIAKYEGRYYVVDRDIDLFIGKGWKTIKGCAREFNRACLASLDSHLSSR